MIRIPFDDQVGNATATASGETTRSAVGAEQTEERLRFMEETLARHAGEIHSSALERIGRIESRVHRAVFLLSSDAAEQCEENVVEFCGAGGGAGGTVGHHALPAKAAQDALFELNATLKVTREHLDALGSSVRRLRAAVGKRA